MLTGWKKLRQVRNAEDKNQGFLLITQYIVEQQNALVVHGAVFFVLFTESLLAFCSLLIPRSYVCIVIEITGFA